MLDQLSLSPLLITLGLGGMPLPLKHISTHTRLSDDPDKGWNRFERKLTGINGTPRRLEATPARQTKRKRLAGLWWLCSKHDSVSDSTLPSCTVRSSSSPNAANLLMELILGDSPWSINRLTTFLLVGCEGSSSGVSTLVKSNSRQFTISSGHCDGDSCEGPGCEASPTRTPRKPYLALHVTGNQRDPTDSSLKTPPDR